MSWQALRHWAEYLTFRTLVCFVQALSPRMSVRIAHWAAGFICHCLPRRLTRHDVARANLRQAFGDTYSDAQLDATIYRMWVHLFRMVAEMVQLPRRLRLDNVVDQIVFRNKPEVVRALCSGRPCI
ncbi:MAG: lipid A biosynthesis acyltransferase, partial [Planctomycetales bacterium]